MTSTVLDVAVCLVLVSAAAVTLGTAPPETDPPSPRAPAVAETLSTATTGVEYRLTPVAGASPTPEYDRYAQGTYARLLASAAVANVAVDGAELSPATRDFRAAITRSVNETLAPRTQVLVRWEPYPGAPLAGAYAVGPTPPPEATVRAATLTVSTRFERPDSRLGADEREYDDVADAVARSVVDGLFPPAETRLALSDDAPLPSLVTRRYRRVGTALGVDVNGVAGDDAGEGMAPASVEATNARLADALSTRLAADMRTRFETPAAAADAVSIGEVRVVVRTWSA